MLGFALAVVLIPVIALTLLTFAFTCYDRFGWATLTSVVGVGLIATTTTAQEYFMQYGVMGVAAVVVGYVVAGLIVMFIKWLLAVRGFGNKLAEFVNEFNTDNPTLTEKQIKQNLHNGETLEETGEDVVRRRALASDLSRDSTRRALFGIDQTKIDTDHGRVKVAVSSNALIDAIHPKMKQHVGTLTAWTFYWPFVLLSLVLKNFVIDLVQNIISMFGGIMNRISRRIVTSMTKDVQL